VNLNQKNVIIGEIVNHNCDFCHLSFKSNGFVILHIRIRISENRQYNGQKKRVQKDKQRSTKHSYKTKDRVTRTPQKLRVNSGALTSLCSFLLLIAAYLAVFVDVAIDEEILINAQYIAK
jgi:hypothetical protein